MEIISQKTTDVQQKTPTDILHSIPIVLVEDDATAYILVRELHEDMYNFIQNGVAPSLEIGVFSEEHEKELFALWKSLGFDCVYRRQPIEYMHQRVTIRYLQVGNPKTGLRISLIPWFMPPGRPYPVFLYVYAIWHYENSPQKSMQFSAAVAGGLFGVDSFNKGTLSRSLRVMGQLVDDIQADRPLSAGEPATPPPDDIINRIPGLLGGCPTMESLAGACGGKAAKTPPPIKRATGGASHILSRIPARLSKVTKEKKAAEKAGGGTTRTRPARKKKKRSPATKRRPDFVGSGHLGRTRVEFIATCMNCVLDAAMTFHRFLI